MKTIFTAAALLCFLVIACNRHDADDQTEKNLDTLSLEQRARAVVTWKAFMEDSNDGIDATQTKVDSLRAKIHLAPAKDKVRLRRTINTAEYRLEKLRKELYDHDTWFAHHIETFTAENSDKIASFKVRFEAKLSVLNNELDN